MHISLMCDSSSSPQTERTMLSHATRLANTHARPVYFITFVLKSSKKGPSSIMRIEASPKKKSVLKSQRLINLDSSLYRKGFESELEGHFSRNLVSPYKHLGDPLISHKQQFGLLSPPAAHPQLFIMNRSARPD